MAIRINLFLHINNLLVGQFDEVQIVVKERMEKTMTQISQIVKYKSLFYHDKCLNLTDEYIEK